MFPIILRRHVLILLVAKAALLTLLYFLFFSPAHQMNVTGARLREHIVGQ